MGKLANLIWASFSGRGDRKEFWIGFVMMVVAGGLLSLAGARIGVSPLWSRLLVLPLWFFYAGRRFHDLGLSSGLSMIPLMTVFVLGIALGVIGIDPLFGATIVAGCSLAVTLGMVLWLGCARGQPDANEYGPPPGQEDAADLF